MLPTTSSPDQKWINLLKWISLALAAVYLANCISPLRFHVDTNRYFAIKDCFEIGCAPDSVAAQDYLPYGYTFLLLGLSKAGILHSFTIILINAVYLLAALYFTTRIFAGMFNKYLLFVLVLLNWTTIKFMVHPLSEMQYLFFSMAALYFFYRYTQEKKILPLLLAFACGALAFFTRTVGVTLIAALVAGIMWEYRQQIIQLVKKHKVILIALAVLVVLVIVFSKFLGLDHYTGVLTKQFDEGAQVTRVFKWHLTEFTEIGLNTSIARLNTIFSPTASSIIFISIGVLYLAGYIYLLFIRRNNIPFVVKAYLLFYTLLMFNWPFYDPRFWVPVVPLFIALVCQVKITTVKWRRLSYVLIVPYVVSGIAAIGYMTYTSFNKEVLARKQANGVYRNEYETYFFGKPLSDTAKKTDAYLLDVLKRHN
ncbi:MAG: hypothetical protein ACO1NW_14530 [Chitinophagaceae bacterium]